MLKLIVYENGCEREICTYLVDHTKTEEIKELIDDYLKEPAESQLHCLQVRRADKKETIFLKHVLYFVSDKRKIKAVFDTSDESLEFYMKLSDVEMLLKDSGFLRCHQSYLVNTQHILHCDGTNIVLAGNEKIPISRRYKQSASQWLGSLAIDA